MQDESNVAWFLLNFCLIGSAGAREAGPIPYESVANAFAG